MVTRPVQRLTASEEQWRIERPAEVVAAPRAAPRHLEHLPETLVAPTEHGAADHLVGMTLPEVALRDDKGEPVRLDLLGDRAVLFFFPMVAPAGGGGAENASAVPGARGCTPEICAFRDIWANFRRHRVALVGVSTHGWEELAQVRRQLRLPFPLLSDEEGRARLAMGLPCFEVGDTVYLQRLTLVAVEGTVTQMFHPVFLPGAHPYQVLAEVQALDPGPLAAGSSLGSDLPREA
jgi:peroxiredoxin